MQRQQFNPAREFKIDFAEFQILYTVIKIVELVRHSERGRRPIYQGDGQLSNTSA